jgi:GAF domain-containing protein
MATQGLAPDLVEHVREFEARRDAAARRQPRMFVDFAQAKSRSGADRVFLDAGLRLRADTRLVAHDGTVVGVIRTFWHALHQPTERELRYLDLLARLAADAIERQLAGDAMRDHVDELTRFNEAAVARETRMIELKKEVNALAERLGEPSRYSLDFERNAD